MRPLAAFMLALSCPLPTFAQDTFKDFKTRIDARLRSHAFFSRVKTIAVEKPPFLFYIEKAPDDASDYELAVVNGYLPFLRELKDQFEAQYRKPLNLEQWPDAPAYAIAILTSAGRYLDFRTAIGDPTLANARAHYTPDLQLAVTYQDTFSRFNVKAEERQSLLHEFVHALQHAHAKGGVMPQPVWFNEGLAEYRSSCTNMANSLREPPLHNHHVRSMAFGYLGRAGRFYVSPIADLVAANSYGDIVEFAKKRNNAEVRGDLAVSMFYAQAEMFVRFLHEAEAGKYRPAFLDYTRQVQTGAKGLEVFQKAFQCPQPDHLAALDTAWRQWLDGVMRRQYPTMPSLAKGAEQTGAMATLPPPIAFDARGLQWTPADAGERLDGAHRLCANGQYEDALAVLPDEAADQPTTQRLARVRERIGAVRQLREAVLADYDKRKPAVTLGGVRGKYVRRGDGSVVVLVGKTEETVPLAAFTPSDLVREGARLKQFEGKAAWLDIWLCWLQGQTLASLAGKLGKAYSTISDLRQDLTADFDVKTGRGAAAIIELQQMPATEDPAEAKRHLDRLLDLVRQAGASPAMQRRKEPISRQAQAYAERCFRTDDTRALGIRGTVKELGDGRITVTYPEPQLAPTADFTPVPDADRKWLGKRPRLPYAGTSGISSQAGSYQLVGSATLRWAVPLTGAQVVEVDFRVNEGVFPDFLFVMSAIEGAGLFVGPGGSIQVLDVHDEEVDPTPLGGGAAVVIGQPNKLRLDFDGKKVLTTSVNGKVTSTVDVGRLQGGELWLLTHSGTPVQLDNLSITGKPDPSDPQAMRDRFVASVLAGLWR